MIYKHFKIQGLNLNLTSLHFNLTSLHFNLTSLHFNLRVRINFLPAYSPQLNPIEEVFSKWKHIIKARNSKLRSS